MVETVHANAFWMSVAFVLGYLMITFEHYTKINKAAIALLMAIICWILQFAASTTSQQTNMEALLHHFANVSQIVFFLIGALTIVETVNVYNGFELISNAIKVKSIHVLLWTVGFLAFFLSAILDNLTTTVVMITLLTKLMKNSEERLLIGGGIVIAANAGGAWTPIGDVTTTMLWIGGEVSALNIMKELLIPALVCLIVSFACLSLILKKKPTEPPPQEDTNQESAKAPPSKLLANLMLLAGIFCLVFVPVFSLLTQLPPYMGMLFGLSMLWLLTDVIHFKSKNEQDLRVPYVFSRIDLASPLFFLGILLAIDALDTALILRDVAAFVETAIGNLNVIAGTIGIVSAVIDNVPLVAATMGMYDLAHYPKDSPFWNLIAYCAGTGGSILLIGSAAGIVFMGMEKVDFFWYMKRISLPALVGYFAGIGAYLLFS
jgi:Na+/H+ antiporter NhaD/arsenite permease-like protein